MAVADAPAVPSCAERLDAALVALDRLAAAVDDLLRIGPGLARTHVADAALTEAQAALDHARLVVSP